MKRTVKIQKMFGGQSEPEIKIFATERDARQYYRAFCDEHGMDDRGDWAGGIGYDYSIVLAEDDPEPVAKWPQNVDWNNATPDMLFHAVNENGSGSFHQAEPLPVAPVNKDGFWLSHTWVSYTDRKSYDLTNLDWRTTLTRRPDDY